MSLFFQIATFFDRLGARGFVAKVATFLYAHRNPRQSFAIGNKGQWINIQADATVASPVIHTATLEGFSDWVLDLWCHKLLPQTGDTVIDVGAGVGEEAIVFSKLVGPNGRVIAIEAHPETFECLKETIRLSRLRNVVPVNVAIGDCDGVTNIGRGENFLQNSIVGANQTDSIEVPMRSLDSLSEELGLDHIALIKMNIEGAETAAVRGMGKLAQSTQACVVSCHDFIADRGGGEEFRTKTDVLPLLLEQGFFVTCRTEIPEPWIRDCLHGTRASPSN